MELGIIMILWFPNSTYIRLACTESSQLCRLKGAIWSSFPSAQPSFTSVCILDGRGLGLSTCGPGGHQLGRSGESLLVRRCLLVVECEGELGEVVNGQLSQRWHAPCMDII